MKIIDPYIIIQDKINGEEILKNIEKTIRVCYKSEERIKNQSAEKLITKIINSNHESTLEHEKITIKIVCDRGVSHELVRHRIASYTQESTRYCNYSKAKFNNQITVIKPNFWQEPSPELDAWIATMQITERAYFKLLELGASPQQARTVLPTSLKTEVITTMNLRQWRHFLKLRTAKEAHPQMRQIANQILNKLQTQIPIIFNDITPSG